MDPFANVPVTYHLRDAEDGQLAKLLEHFDANEVPSGSSQSSRGRKRCRNLWICKPGENSNRGYGITIVNNRNQLVDMANGLISNRHTLIVQKYIEDPFL